MSLYERKNTCLLVVDVQNDFLPGGQLPVTDGDFVIGPINRLLAESARVFSTVVASQDWHPFDHESFASQHPGKEPGQMIELHGLAQILWPDHCVQDSHGTKLVESLFARKIERIFFKGCDPKVDSYSCFFDNGRRGDTGLGDWLHQSDIKKIAVCGLATDYCVKYTVMDALSLGFDVSVIIDAIRGVNLTATASDDAIHEMALAGAKLVRTRDVLGGLW